MTAIGNGTIHHIFFFCESTFFSITLSSFYEINFILQNRFVKKTLIKIKTVYIE